jgi:phospholipid/cholesterol/gamma-HCH transport system substrate-binding protein
VLEGTTAEIHSVSLAGANEIQLNGAERGRPPITHMGPQGCPVIPASASGLSALLNSAPELLARIQTLTERLTELLSDRNQNSIADILENIDAERQHGRRQASRLISGRGAAVAPRPSSSASTCEFAVLQHKPCCS